MKNRKWIVVAGVWVALALITLATGCGPALNNFMSYQGRLTDDGGNPINGTRNITFRLYGAETGGTAIWEETHGGVQVNNGLFNVVLGANTALDEANFHQPLFLEVEVAGQTLSPRQQLLGAPYAFSLVPGAVVKGSISASETFSSTLNVFNWGDGQGIAVGSNGTALVASGGSECGNHGVYGQTGGDWCWSSGVYGKATKDHAIGVTGWNTAGGAGVHGYSVTGDGVYGKADAGDKSGVYGWSENGFGVTGRSRNNNGAQGFSTNAYGVYGDGKVYGFYTPDKVYAGNGYVDIAEHIDAASDVEAGDVVVIDPDHDERVVKSTRPYDTAVAGIISTDPAMLIGSSDTTTPLALAGRVPCKVSAENGPIHRGDLLTTSSTPGHAMKATEFKLGAILGKAFGELESGTGVIYVLVTLQ
jgi:hypothetical protein